MAPLPTTSTKRLVVQYSGEAGVHDIMFRFDDSVAPADGVAAAQDILTAMKVWVTDTTTFESAVWYPKGEVNSFPVAWTPIVGTNTNEMTEDEYPNFISFVGRTGTGRRVRYTLNGIPQSPNDDYRYQRSENASVDAVLDALETAEPQPVAIDLELPFYNPYANLGRNSYFQRKRRVVS